VLASNWSVAILAILSVGMKINPRIEIAAKTMTKLINLVSQRMVTPEYLTLDYCAQRLATSEIAERSLLRMALLTPTLLFNRN
jgi:hypothetical protein